MLKDKFFSFYARNFAVLPLYRFHRFMYRVSMIGMGVLNYRDGDESGENYFLKTYLKIKSGNFIDIGANQGKYANQVLKVNPKLNGYLFEPHLETFAKLKKNFANEPRLKLINKAVSSAPGNLDLFDYENSGGSQHATLYPMVMTEIHRANKVKSWNVESVTLDDFMELKGLDEIELLKIHVEGNELNVLQGAKRALRDRKIKCIHFEFNEMNIASKSTFKDFWDLLDEYSFYRLLPSCLLPIKQHNPSIQKYMLIRI